MVKNDERLLKGFEIARVLNISRSLAYRLMQKGEIQTIRFGKSLRVCEEDLKSFIDEHKVNKKNSL